MESLTDDFEVTKWKDFIVKVHAKKGKQIPHHLLRGRALLNPEDYEMTFVENNPRGARSVEVGRTPHSRFVKRPDGAYTLTLRFRHDEKYIKEVLISEIRNALQQIKNSEEKSKVIEVSNQKKSKNDTRRN